MTRRFNYSRWDGTQVGFEMDADDLLSEITDDLLYHGDLNAALRRLMQSGFRDRNQERIQGICDMLEQLRRKRRDELEKYDLGGVDVSYSKANHEGSKYVELTIIGPGEKFTK